ncbi:MAG: FtsX-like permease family protein [Pseudolysinimonas sp.]
MSGIGTLALFARHLRSGWTASVIVAIIVATSVFAVALAPRALERLGTAELRSEFSAQTPALLDLTGSGEIGLVPGMPNASADTLLGPTDEAIAKIPGRLPSPLSDGASAAEWLIRSNTSKGVLPQPTILESALKLAIDLDWEDRVTFVSGAAPAAWEGDEADQDFVELPLIEVAVSRTAADLMEVEVGDVIGFHPADLVVAGIYDLVDPDDPYWAHTSDLARGLVDVETGKPPTVRASVYVDPESIVGLLNVFAAGDLACWVPLDPSAYDYADVAALVIQTRKAGTTRVSLPSYGSLIFRSGMSDVIEKVQGRVTSTSALLALTTSGLLGLLLAVFALGIQIVIRRRRTALALASARGAGVLQVRGTMFAEGLLIAVPGSIVAMTVAAIALPGPVGLDAWVLPAVVALAPAVLAAVLTTPRALAESRGDLRVRSRSRVRWVAEVAVVLLAAVAVLLLTRRGLVAASSVVGTDPLLASAPLLLAAASCVVALRLYPLPLRAAQQAQRGRRGAAGLLGAARAVRDPALGFVAALAMVVGIFVVIFSLITITTVERGLEQGSRDDVGADVQVLAHDLPESLVSDLTALDGVRAAVTLTTASGVGFSDEIGGTEVNVLFADTVALHAVRPDIPVLTPRADGRLTLLISSDWASRVSGTELMVGSSLAAPAGVIASNALPGISRHWVLVDASEAQGIGIDAEIPSRLLVALDPDAPASVESIEEVVLAAQPDTYEDSVHVLDASSRLAEVQASPTVAGLRFALVVTAIASLLLTLLTVVLASVAAAASRNRMVGVLRVLGVSPSQIRAVLAWELAPVAVMAVVVGTALGVALPFLVTSVLDLRVFVGGNVQPVPAIEPLWLVGAIAVFVAVVALAGLLASALGRRFAPAGALKMGEE